MLTKRLNYLVGISHRQTGLLTNNYNTTVPIYRPVQARGSIPFITVSWQGIVLTTLATLVVGLLSENIVRLYGLSSTLVLFTVHWITLFFPIEYASRVYRRFHDLFDPLFVGVVTFAVFHIAFDPFIFGSLQLLVSRRLDFFGTSNLTIFILISYSVLFISWWAFRLGVALVPEINSAKISTKDTFVRRRVSPSYLFVGLAFTFIGIIGNVEMIGGLTNYLTKMLAFYERWSVYEEASYYGATKWLIAMRFLPVGLIIIACGWWLQRRRPDLYLVMALAVASITNVFLSSATGQRSQTLMVLLYAVIIFNVIVNRYHFAAFAGITTAILAVSIVLGTFRGASYYHVDAVNYLTNEFGSLVSHFTTSYLSNYLGTLTLVTQVQTSGIINGETAFAGLTGLLGGPTPITTERKVWYLIFNQINPSNARYGPPGELFFNFGWIGVVVGMLLIGVVIAFLARMYRRHSSEKSLLAVLIGVFAVFTSEFLLIANLSYIPSYFTYFSLPFYLGFLLFRNSKRTQSYFYGFTQKGSLNNASQTSNSLRDRRF